MLQYCWRKPYIVTLVRYVVQLIIRILGKNILLDVVISLLRAARELHPKVFSNRFKSAFRDNIYYLLELHYKRVQKFQKERHVMCTHVHSFGGLSTNGQRIIRYTSFIEVSYHCQPRRNCKAYLSQWDRWH